MTNRIIVEKHLFNYKNRQCVYYIMECLGCGNNFKLSGARFNSGKNRGKFCSHKCDGLFKVGKERNICQSGTKASNWKNGKSFSGKYIYTSIYLLSEKEKEIFSSMFNKHNYCYEHRLVAAKLLNRILKPEEIIHHINGNKIDNSSENLYLFKTRNEHDSYEGLKNKYALKSNLPMG